MIAILALRTASSALTVLFAIVHGNVAGIIIYSILAVLSLWFTATCLAIIGNTAGDPNYSGRIVSFSTSINSTRQACWLTNTLETLVLRRLLGNLSTGPCRTDCRLVLRTHGLGLGGSWDWNVARHSRSCLDGGMGAKVLLLGMDDLKPDRSPSMLPWPQNSIPTRPHHAVSTPLWALVSESLVYRCQHRSVFSFSQSDR